MRILNNCGIKVALKPLQTLGHIFAKPKDGVPTDRKTHAVYSIPCGDCEKEYLGQTKRQFGTHLKEHQRAVSNLYSSKSTLAEHVCKTSHKIAWEDSKIITTNNRYGRGGSRRVPPMRVHRSNQFENDEVTLLTNKRNLHGYFEYSTPYLVQYIKLEIYSI